MLRGFLSSVTSSAPVSKVTTPWSSRPPSAMSSRKPSVSEVPTFEPPVVDLSGFSPAERAQLEAVLNRVEMETKTTQLQDVAKAISPEKTEGVDTLTGLTVEEQRQIEAVLKRAEAELSGKPPAQPKSDPIGHKFDLSEFNDAERQRLEEMIKLADVATEAAVKAIPLSSATTDKTSAYSSRKCSTVSDASLAPSLAEIDLSGLTPEEKQQIEAVMRKLEPGTSQSFEPQSLVESGFEPRSDLSDSTFEPQTESQHANDNFESQRHHNDDNMDISSEFVNFTGEFCRITTPSPTEPAQFDDFPEVPSRQKSLDDVGRYLPASPLPSRPQSPFLRADSRYDASAILAEVDLTQFSEEERAHIEEVLSRAASNSSISPGPSASDTKVMPETSPGKTYLASPDYPSYPPTPGATFTPAYGEIFISEEPELPDQTEISSKRSTLSSSSSRDRWETANMESSAELKAKRRPKWAERHVSVDEVEMGSYTEDLAAELPIKSDLEPLEEVKMLPLSPLIEARIEPPSTGEETLVTSTLPSNSDLDCERNCPSRLEFQLAVDRKSKKISFHLAFHLWFFLFSFIQIVGKPKWREL